MSKWIGTIEAWSLFSGNFAAQENKKNNHCLNLKITRQNYTSYMTYFCNLIICLHKIDPPPPSSKVFFQGVYLFISGTEMKNDTFSYVVPHLLILQHLFLSILTFLIFNLILPD